jgi:uncharacterized membrane protein
MINRSPLYSVALGVFIGNTFIYWSTKGSTSLLVGVLAACFTVIIGESCFWVAGLIRRKLDR